MVPFELITDFFGWTKKRWALGLFIAVFVAAVATTAVIAIALRYYGSCCSSFDITDVYCTIIIFLMTFAMEHTMKIQYSPVQSCGR